jgi:NADP-dependent 3-hydroxy acid dehydrogenase YdfG
MFPKKMNRKKIKKIIEKNFRSLDILINNAGINGIDQKLSPQDPENIDINTRRYLHKNNLESNGMDLPDLQNEEQMLIF